MKKLIIIIASVLILSTLVLAVGTNSDAKNFIISKFQEDWDVEIDPIMHSDWHINYFSYEEGITTNIINVDEITLQLGITNTNGGGYKFHSAICNLSNVDSIGLQIKDNAEQWTSIGNANYGKLTDYGMPETWCEETNNEGFILFSSGSKDVDYRLTFPEGEKHLILITGSSSEYVYISYGDINYIGGLAFIKFTSDEVGRKNNDVITAVKFG